MKNLLLITSIALFIALVPMPYFYYQLIRWLVCITSIILISNDQVSKSQAEKIIYIIIAIIFNPIAPIHFPAIFWKIIDLVTAIYFLTLSKDRKF